MGATCFRLVVIGSGIKRCGIQGLWQLSLTRDDAVTQPGLSLLGDVLLMGRIGHVVFAAILY